jgi:hypothetical protein
LAELHPVGNIGPGSAVSSIELDADNQADFVLELVGNPILNRLKCDRIGVGVNPALLAQDKVTEEIGPHADVRDVLEGIEHPLVVGVVFVDKFSSSFEADKCAEALVLAKEHFQNCGLAPATASIRSAESSASVGAKRTGDGIINAKNRATH